MDSIEGLMWDNAFIKNELPFDIWEIYLLCMHTFVL